MSDDSVGRYRRVFPRLWRHPGFQKHSTTQRELALYVLTGPQANRIGLFFFSVPTAAEDLGVAVETVRKGLGELSTTFGWLYDTSARLLYIPSWWRWNVPANENILKGNLKDLSEIPSSALVDAFARNLETLPERFHATFIEGCRQRLPKPSPIQDQDQDQDQDQEQEQETGTVVRAARGKGASRPTLSPPQEQKSKPEDRHLELARQALKLTGPSVAFEHLVDACLGLANHEKVRLTREQATVALNEALADRRLRAVM